ncbi:MAG TPA: phosphotransferase family protein [Longimicrobiaceae bacterium]|nr:phosphotransferase family protein [Longimicrobiaceae bacterium]
MIEGESASAVDRPGEVRAGEELDVGALESYLRAHLPGVEGPVEVRQYPRGFSNLTYLVRAGGRELVLRRPPFGADVRGGHDVEREHRVLAGLHPVWPKAPRPVLSCADASVIGAPFYLMERVEGVILRDRPPAGVALDPPAMRGVCLALVDTLAELHAVDWRGAGLEGLGRPEGYVERQVSGWTARWEKARTDDVPEMDAAAAWLAANRPRESGTALIHGDYKYDNLVLDPAHLSRVRAVLDWEMATIGDPLMDLGTSLGYWAEAGDPPEMKMFGLTHLPGNLTRREVAERYAERTGRDVSGIAFHYVYGLFKVGVIAQQIYARFKAGKTRDPRFGGLIHVVRAAGRMAETAAERGRVGG